MTARSRQGTFRAPETTVSRRGTFRLSESDPETTESEQEYKDAEEGPSRARMHASSSSPEPRQVEDLLEEPTRPEPERVGQPLVERTDQKNSPFDTNEACSAMTVASRALTESAPPVVVFFPLHSKRIDSRSAWVVKLIRTFLRSVSPYIGVMTGSHDSGNESRSLVMKRESLIFAPASFAARRK